MPPEVAVVISLKNKSVGSRGRRAPHNANNDITVKLVGGAATSPYWKALADLRLVGIIFPSNAVAFSG